MGHESGMRNTEAWTSAVNSMVGTMNAVRGVNQRERYLDIAEEEADIKRVEREEKKEHEQLVEKYGKQMQKARQAGADIGPTEDTDTKAWNEAEAEILAAESRRNALDAENIELKNLKREQNQKKVLDKITESDKIALVDGEQAGLKHLMSNVYNEYFPDGAEFVRLGATEGTGVFKNLATGKEYERKIPDFKEARQIALRFGSDYINFEREMDRKRRMQNNSSIYNPDRVYSKDGSVKGYRYLMWDKNGAIRTTYRSEKGDNVIGGFNEKTGEWVELEQLLETAEYWNKRAEGVKEASEKAEDAEEKRNLTINQITEDQAKAIEDAKEEDELKGKINGIKFRAINSKARKEKLPVLKEVENPETGKVDYIYDVSQYIEDLKRIQKSKGKEATAKAFSKFPYVTQQIIREQQEAERAQKEQQEAEESTAKNKQVEQSEKALERSMLSAAKREVAKEKNRERMITYDREPEKKKKTTERTEPPSEETLSELEKLKRGLR